MQSAPRLVKGGKISTGRGMLQNADILIGSDGHISNIAPKIAPDAGVEVIDAAGCIISPGFIDAHQHLDKTGVLRFAPNPSGTLQGAREAFAKYARTATPEDVHNRASKTVAQCLLHGTTAIRSHVNVDKDAGFSGMEALTELRKGWAGRVRIQLVAFMTPHPGQDLDWLRTNIDRAVEHADAVGGTPAVAEDPDQYLDILFEAAARHDLPVDLHLDEHLDPTRPLFANVFERVRRFGLQGRTVLSHASVLSALPRDRFEAIMAEILELDLGVVTLPAANLYLQGRDQDIMPPRGLTRVAELARAGVPIATASDNIQDPFVPTGSGDMLEIARWTLLAGHLKGDELPLAYSMITDIPARLMGLDNHGIRQGAPADFLIARSEDVETLVAGGSQDLRVMAKGKAISTFAAKFETCSGSQPENRHIGESCD
ncbi:deaminase [Paracoccus methylarcula]|uniref:Deaminase n=2 Tax=Paracoccus methylarcula TaxID=72022 RepID=A0A3R7LQK0_9RHOB|nr:deaminase [Paracoccus methylarcula]